jgi:DNA-binding Xre family transcriptional regulator
MIVIRLKELAEARHLNQSRVQLQAGLTMGLVRRYWFNETKEIKLEALEKLCHALSCKPCDLITLDDAPPPALTSHNHEQPLAKHRGRMASAGYS